MFCVTESYIHEEKSKKDTSHRAVKNQGTIPTQSCYLTLIKTTKQLKFPLLEPQGENETRTKKIDNKPYPTQFTNRNPKGSTATECLLLTSSFCGSFCFDDPNANRPGRKWVQSQRLPHSNYFHQHFETRQERRPHQPIHH